MTAPLPKLTVPVATLIAGAQKAFDADKAKVADSKAKHEAGEAAARAKIVAALRKEADRIERGGDIKSEGRRYNHELREYSDFQYTTTVTALYPGIRRPNDKIRSDLALLKASTAETIAMATDSEWARYL